MTEVENPFKEEKEYIDLIALKARRGCKVNRDVLLEELKITELCINIEILLCRGKEDSERLIHLKHEKSLLRDEILKLSIIPS